jgi:hypothetical protein
MTILTGCGAVLPRAAGLSGGHSSMVSEWGWPPNAGGASLQTAEILGDRFDVTVRQLCEIRGHLAHAAQRHVIPNGPGTKGLLYQLNLLCQPYVSHSAAGGALPLLFAATPPEAQNSGYYGPNWFYELKGPPAPAFVAPQAKDTAAAKRLWDLSEQLTGTRWAA